MTIEQVFDAILGQAGVLVLLLIILWSGWRGMWVFGWYARELRDRNERLESRLDKAVSVAESGAKLSNRALGQAEERHAEVSNE